ncbi:Reverse transcriptase zinc-binding domain [Sesbania bispinosa]|nr:Reverse transcriptase zinc-binding domain [Sesbania bispinosa]
MEVDGNDGPMELVDCLGPHRAMGDPGETKLLVSPHGKPPDAVHNGPEPNTDGTWMTSENVSHPAMEGIVFQQREPGPGTYHQQGWKLNTLHGLLPADVVAEIVALPCPDPSLGLDFVCRGGTPNGQFSTKTTYTLIKSSYRFIQDPVRSAVWKWEGHQRVHCLLWIILNNGLKTRSKGFRRGFMESDVCPLCMNHEETTTHIIRDCVKVQQVWFQLAWGILPTDFFSASVREWILANIGPHSDSNWRLIFGLTI